ncbi:hypothetical protein [Streptomyces sp. S465]|uniref:hypothetical protein n=1 Tax=Streptomyces sp. S465 TaxID=2979468 RepID=UPI0022A894B9|nr:hypothetical protein [Streptomyces sp. S465]WAP53766.1 hypothetical protein N6H00_01705 [Streptomyces sp. S465]
MGTPLTVLTGRRVGVRASGRTTGDDASAGRVVAAGWSASLVACLEIAGRYALEPGLITQPVDVAEPQEKTAFLDT